MFSAKAINTLSRRILITGNPAQLTTSEIISRLLSNLVRELGSDLVGHAKAVAHLNGGVVHASTTGSPPDVNVTVVGTPAQSQVQFRLDFMCAFHGISERVLGSAWNASLRTLSVAGVAFEEVTLATQDELKPPRRAADFTVAGSFISSFLVLKPCCLIPVLWSLSGSSVAALQVLKPLEPYRPHFMVVSALFLVVAVYKTYFDPTIRVRNLRATMLTSRRLLWIAIAGFIFATVYPMLVNDQSYAGHHHATAL